MKGEESKHAAVYGEPNAVKQLKIFDSHSPEAQFR